MARLKQRIQAFQTAEMNYNRKRVALRIEFTSEMHKACKANDLEYFEALKNDFRIYFNEADELTIISIELMYGLNGA